MLDTSKFKDYIAGITDNEKPTSNVFLLEGTIRALTGLSSACEAEETKDKRGELFEQQVFMLAQTDLDFHFSSPLRCRVAPEGPARR